MKIVLDSSTLILLAKIDLLRLVSENFECVITEEVKKESTKKKDAIDAKMIMQLIKERKIKIVKTRTKKELKYEFKLGEGEASTLNFARTKNMVAATDDKSAINACRVFNIRFVTAVDFVIRGYEKGKINKYEAKAKINKLDEYGRYGTKIIKDALEKLGDKHE